MPDARADRIQRAGVALRDFLTNPEDRNKDRPLQPAEIARLQALVNASEIPVVLHLVNLSDQTATEHLLIPGGTPPEYPSHPSPSSHPAKTRTRR